MSDSDDSVAESVQKTQEQVDKDDNDQIHGFLEDCAYPDRQTAKLIELWKQRECLFEVTHKWYHRRDKRDAAKESMAAELRCTVKHLSTRINSLKTQYTKAKRMEKSGSGALSAKKRRTLERQREMLSFLEPTRRKRKSHSNITSSEEESEEDQLDPDLDKISVTASEEAAGPKGKLGNKPHLRKSSKPIASQQETVNVSSDSEGENNNVDSPKSTKKPLARRTPKRVASTKDNSEVVKAIMKMYNKECDNDGDVEKIDDVGIFCEHMARQLRIVEDKRYRVMAQNELHNVLCNVQMNALSQPAACAAAQPTQPTSTYHGPQLHYFQQYPETSYTTDITNDQNVENDTALNVEKVNKSSANSKTSNATSVVGKKTYTTLQNTAMVAPKTTRMCLRPKGNNNSKSTIGSPNEYNSGDSITELPFDKL